jgi:hypothetical protein
VSDRDAATMADQTKKATGVPLTNIAVLLALLGGVALYRLPLTSPRPGVEPGRGTVGWAEQDVDARLWQDPLEVSTKHRDSLPHGKDVKVAEGKAEADAHEVTTVRSVLIEERPQCEQTVAGCAEETPPRILAVVVPGAAYEEYVERRLRTRHAVVEGLAALGFIPDDYLHIGYFELQWPTASERLVDAATNALRREEPARALLVPYEWYRAPGWSGDPHLLVLWLRADALADRPLERLAAVLGSLGSIPIPPEALGPIPAAVIGPMSSNDLVAMRNEQPPLWAQSVLGRVKMYSAFASASEATLRSATPKDMRSMDEVLQTSVPGFHLTRTIASDWRLMLGTARELKRRGLWGARGGRIVLLTELDTVYTRGLAETFIKTARKKPRFIDDQIETVFYPEGIDGKVPTNRKDEKPSEPAPQPDKTKDRPKEATEGADQSDYLRRLATRLQQENDHIRWQNGAGIRAVGVLGADVFDKIMILRALRRALPEAIFFTNNLDARLMDPDEWAATHNLVIASTYGLDPNAILEAHGLRVPSKPKLSYAPFRDAYEASAFAATLSAVQVDVSRRPPAVQLYEIGRSGAFQVTNPVPPVWVTGWTASRWKPLIVAVLSLAVLLVWARSMHDGTLAPTRLKGSSPRCRLNWPKLADVMTSTTLFVLLVCPPAIVALLWLAQRLAEHDGEPVVFLEGISIWPSEILRLLVGLLGVHFLLKSMAAVKASNGKLAETFHLDDEVGQPPTVVVDGVEHVVASTTWAEYVRAGRLWERVKRVIPPFLLYYAFGLSLMAMLGFPRVPGRGKHDILVNLVITVGLAATVTIFLLFFVIDVMWLNRVMLVQKLMDKPTRWPKELLQEHRPERDANPKVDACLSELLDIKLIAARTAVTGPLIYWPFLLIALTIVSRLSYFDDWDFPVTLIVVFALNAGGAVFAAMTLRQSAEYARKRALETLRSILHGATVSEQGMAPDPRDRAVVATAKSAIEEVENLSTGAFGSFAQNPVVQALLLPGGASIIAAAQSLLQ